MKPILLAACLALLPALGHAEVGDLAVGAGVGTTGVDLALTYKAADNVNVRGVLSGVDYDRDDRYGTDVDFAGTFELFHAGVLADLYPTSGGFRVTGGIVYNGTKLALDGKPRSGGSYEIGGQTYTADQVGSLNAEAKWDKPGLYLGIGFGDPVRTKGLSFSGDLGVIYTGSPDTNLRARCGTALDAAGCAQLQQDAAVEERKLRDDADKIKYWPVARIMANYAF